jgi:medium-chain acyl-[acyl-carrier-protein] hydrolase
MHTQWVIGPGRSAVARCRLFCFPHAGGSASFFAPWVSMASNAIEVCPVELPGRGSRIREEAFHELAPMVDALVTELRPWLQLPFAFFGHSMGALIAYELSRELAGRAAQTPVSIYVSGNAAPHIPQRETPVHGLEDDAFVRELRRLGGTPDAVLENRELLALLLPVLRSDFAVCETYCHQNGSPLACPIVAFGGLSDRFISAEALKAWAGHTSASFCCHLMPGGHFYLMQHMQAVLSLVEEHVTMQKPGVHVCRNTSSETEG